MRRAANTHRTVYTSVLSFSLVLLELCFRLPILDCSNRRQKSRSTRLINSRIDDSCVCLNQTTRLDEREKKRREITDEHDSDFSKQHTVND